MKVAQIVVAHAHALLDRVRLVRAELSLEDRLAIRRRLVRLLDPTLVQRVVVAEAAVNALDDARVRRGVGRLRLEEINRELERLEPRRVRCGLLRDEE
eukprot:14681-Pelagococcus_subviridis.AAC.6